MNYSLFERYVLRVQDDLIRDFGIPREAAEDIARYMDVVGITAEARERGDAQYEMDYRSHGADAMAERHGISRQTARKRFNRIVRTKMERVVSA